MFKCIPKWKILIKSGIIIVQVIQMLKFNVTFIQNCVSIRFKM